MLRSPSLSRLLSASRSPTQCQVFPSRQLPSAASPASPSVQAAGWATEGRAGPVHKAARYRPVQAGATQIGGTATSGSVGTTAGSASALGTTAATSAAAASGAPALVVWRRSWQHPFSQSSRSLARRRRWPPRWRSRNHGNVEPRSATPPTAVQTASSGNASNGVAGTGVELAASDGGFAAGATRGLDDGTKNADAGDKKKPKSEEEEEEEEEQGHGQRRARACARGARRRSKPGAHRTRLERRLRRGPTDHCQGVGIRRAGQAPQDRERNAGDGQDPRRLASRELRRSRSTFDRPPQPALDGDHDSATLDDVTVLCDRCHGTANAPRLRASASRGGRYRSK